MEQVKVGLLGLDTVGDGTVTVLQRNADNIARRAGRGIIVLVCVLLASTSFGAVLNIQNGILMGAEDVSVNGALYDVTFQDGTCIDLFGGCDESSDFFFPDVDTAQTANAALLEQVLVDTASGLFDSIPGLTNGCGGATNDFVCNVHSPIGDPPPTATAFIYSAARNRNIDRLDSNTLYGGYLSDVDFTLRDDLTFALWSNPVPVNPVPIPAAVWLFGASLLGLIGISRRKKAT